MLITRDQLTLLILAGGRSRRMQGREKGLISIAGQTMVQHIINRFSSQASMTVISANSSLDSYQQLADMVVTDLQPEYQGPLAGIHAGMLNAKTPFMLVVPCDVPALPSTLIQRLSVCMTDETDVVVISIAQRMQPIIALWRTDMVHSLESALKRGIRKVEDWVRSVRFVELDELENQEYYLNVNTPDDIALAEDLPLHK